MSTDRSPHRRWAWLALAAVVATVLIGAAVLAGTYLFREQPRARSIDDAVGDFRDDPSSAAERTDGLPEAGVYEAAGSGSETISFPPNSQADGDTMPLSVEHLDGGCFRARVDYNEAHWHRWDFCRTSDGLVLGPQENYQRWDFGTLTVENTSRFDCGTAVVIPVGREAGTTTTGTCTGTNTATPGTTTSQESMESLGTSDLRIGDRTIEVTRVQDVAVLSGAQVGENRVVWSFDTATGLPVGAERRYRIDTGSPVGTITYTEEGEWQLTDLEPRR